MACIANRAKAKGVPGWALPAATLIWFGFTLSVNAFTKEEILNASNLQLYAWTQDCLQEASNSHNAKYQTKVLTWAIGHLTQISGRTGLDPELDQAIADVKTALADVQNQEDSDKLKEDINQALLDIHSLTSGSRERPESN